MTKQEQIEAVMREVGKLLMRDDLTDQEGQDATRAADYLSMLRLRQGRPTLETVTAQHDETGRMWEGPRDQLPPRYSVVNTSPVAEWLDLGSLNNGRCSFARRGNGAACKLPAHHEGDHASDYCEHGFLHAKRCPRCQGG